MKKSLGPAIRAGAAFARMSLPPATVPSAEAAPPPPPPPQRGVLRRALRRLARMARPLALPVLHRLQLRMRSAVEESAAAATISRVEQHVAGISTDLLTAKFERLDLQLEYAHRKIDRLADRLDALRASSDQLLQHLSGVPVAADAANEKLGLLLQRNLVAFGDAMAVRTGMGYLLAPAEDRGLVLSLLETAGGLEPGTAAVLAALTPVGGAVIDIGANVGTLTLPAARRVGPRGSVLALEAAPRVADLLARTVQLNGLSWVEVHPLAAGETDGELRFNLSAQSTHNSILALDDITQTIAVPVRRLDTLVPPGARVDLVKIDVEGAELQVWRGMQRVVADNPGIALVLEFGPSHLEKAGQSISGWFEELQSTGLTAWEIDEATGQVRALRRDGLADVFSMNVLLLRDHPSDRGLATS